MDYKAMAAEYNQSADNLQQTINKYKEQIESGKCSNQELINSKIAQYRSIRNEMRYTATMLQQRADRKRGD